MTATDPTAEEINALLGDADETAPTGDPADPADLDADMEKLATQLVKTAMLANTSVEESVDIFKAVATYRLGMKKIKVPEAPKVNAGSFGHMRQRIADAGGSKAN